MSWDPEKHCETELYEEAQKPFDAADKFVISWWGYVAFCVLLYALDRLYVSLAK